MNKSTILTKFLNLNPDIFFIFIYLMLLPAALNIKFQHNDDWVYYISVQNFLAGNFTLHPYIAATTYTQTFLGFIFGKFFDLKFLPALTLFFSVGSAFILFKILENRLKIQKFESLMLSLFLLTNGLFVFTSIGFMTDNYFIFFLLLSFYYFLAPNESNSKIEFLFGVLAVIFAYFTRQLGILIPLAFGLNCILQKKYRESVKYFIFFIILGFYHFFFFHVSSESLEGKPVLSNLFYTQYTYSLLSVVFFYVSFFLLPFVFPKIEFKKANIKKLLWLVLISIILLMFNKFYFKNIGWVINDGLGLRYTLTTKGFFLENLHGKKAFPNITNNIYQILKSLTYLTMSIILGKLIMDKNLKKHLNEFSIFICLYFLSLLVVEKIYDRYLIPIISISIIQIGKNLISEKLSNFRKKTVLVYFLFNLYVVYNFATDYIQTNNYVWNKSQELVSLKQAKASEIVATDSWKFLYPKTETVFKFSYDNPEEIVNEDKVLIEKFQVEYPLQFLNNTIYLYKAKQ